MNTNKELSVYENKESSFISTFGEDTLTKNPEIIFTALNDRSTESKISNYLNVPFLLSNFVISRKEFLDKDTGEFIPANCIFLFDDKNNYCRTGSKGIYESLKNLVMVFGMPDTWEKPIKVVIKDNACSKGHTYTINIVK